MSFDDDCGTRWSDGPAGEVTDVRIIVQDQEVSEKSFMPHEDGDDYDVGMIMTAPAANACFAAAVIQLY